MITVKAMTIRARIKRFVPRKTVFKSTLLIGTLTLLLLLQLHLKSEVAVEGPSSMSIRMSSNRQIQQVNLTIPQRHRPHKNTTTTTDEEEQGEDGDGLINGDILTDKAKETLDTAKETLDTAKDVINTGKEKLDDTKELFEKAKNTTQKIHQDIQNITDELSGIPVTPPVEYNKSQWTSIGILVAVLFCVFLYVWNQIPCLNFLCCKLPCCKCC